MFGQFGLADEVVKTFQSPDVLWKASSWKASISSTQFPVIFHAMYAVPMI